MSLHAGARQVRLFPLSGRFAVRIAAFAAILMSAAEQLIAAGSRHNLAFIEGWLGARR